MTRTVNTMSARAIEALVLESRNSHDAREVAWRRTWLTEHRDAARAVGRADVVDYFDRMLSLLSGESNDH
jgi:hypothetical protein